MSPDIMQEPCDKLCKVKKIIFFKIFAFYLRFQNDYPDWERT